ncbi:ankyrin repeat-containing domain protein [Xylaria grammica]|nr:ankyrin repeat-containing domain protein [Xylaria grammica]
MSFERVGALNDLPDRNIAHRGPLPSQLHIGDTSTKSGSQAFVGINLGSIQYAGTQNSHDPQHEVNACRDALFLTDPYVDRDGLMRTKGKRTAGTCEWIRDNDLYRSWLNDDAHLLWISGGPGKGKTVLSIFLTEELERRCRFSENENLLFYFCSYQDEKRNNAVAVLRGLMYQLLTKRPNLVTHVLPSFDSPKKIEYTSSSVHALCGMLRTLLQDPNLGTVFCILDGLDECDDESSRLLSGFFSSIAEQNNKGFKLVIVSRPEVFGLDPFPHVQLDPDNDGYVNKDIDTFISTRIEELSKIEGFNDEFRAHVKYTLLEKAEGTFLWVGFVMDELSRKRTRTEIQHTLESVPKGLRAIFDRMLLQIKSSQTPKTRLVLRWVMFAVRPLTLAELGAATGIQPSPLISVEHAARDEVALCGPFLKINEDKITFVHQSAKEYLLRLNPDNHREFWFEPEEAHLQIAQECLDLIEISPLRYAPLRLKDEPSQTDSALLEYSIQHWPEHTRHSSTYAKALLDQSRPFLRRNSQVRRNWLYSYPGANSIPYSVLHLACYFGVSSWVEQLLGKRHRPSHRAIAKLLRGRNSKIHVRDPEQGDTALVLAAWRGHADVLSLLLDSGADVNVRNRDGETALMRAGRWDDEATVRLLLDRGADVNMRSKDGETALMSASRWGNEAAVRLLLDRGADINMRSKHGETALMAASGWGNEPAVRLLLDSGADVNGRNRNGETALMAASGWGNEPAVRLLLDSGADVNGRNRNGETALMHAIQKGNQAIVQLLLNRGADANIRDIYGLTALINVSRQGNKTTAQLLLDSGADVNGRNRYGQTALMYAIQNSNQAIVQLLLNRGADVNIRDIDGKTALKAAAELGRTEIVQLLLEYGAESM